MIGKFKVSGTIKIAGRGLVLIGDIIEGIVKAGGVVVIKNGAEEIFLEIKEVDIGDRISRGEFFIGITFIFKDERQKIFFESLNIEGQVLDVFDKQ